MVGAGIITYNPDCELLKKNIEAIIHQVDQMVIIDNASDNIIKIKKLVEIYKIEIILNQVNLGIAKALNQMMEWFENKRFQWVMTLDQDTICVKNIVYELMLYAESKVGIISPAFYDRKIVVNRKIDKIFCEQVKWTITSASLTNVSIWRNIGGFDEKLFIDGVDIDYGIRLNKNGYKVIKVNSISVSHSIGCSRVYNIFGHQLIAKNHNAFRKYYIARNTIIIAKKNGSKKDIIKSYFQIIKQVLFVVFMEKDKYIKVKSIIKGIYDSSSYFER